MNAADWSGRYPRIVEAAARIKGIAIIDAEVVWLAATKTIRDGFVRRLEALISHAPDLSRSALSTLTYRYAAW
jgi:hypothetical protein